MLVWLRARVNYARPVTSIGTKDPAEVTWDSSSNPKTWGELRSYIIYFATDKLLFKEMKLKTHANKKLKRKSYSPFTANWNYRIYMVKYWQQSCQYVTVIIFQQYTTISEWTELLYSQRKFPVLCELDCHNSCLPSICSLIQLSLWTSMQNHIKLENILYSFLKSP